jgi:hypothetical protein
MGWYANDISGIGLGPVQANDDVMVADMAICILVWLGWFLWHDCLYLCHFNNRWKTEVKERK